MTDSEPERHCPWCDARAATGDRQCPACGAALAQRDDLGGLLIPGVTAVDPALADLADRPLRITAGASSPTQSAAPALIIGAALGGPVGLAAIGGVAAVAGAELAAARRPGVTSPEDLEAVGRPSESARQVAARLDGESRPGAASEPVVVDGSAGNSDNSTRD
jgi:hypothetical protein